MMARRVLFMMTMTWLVVVPGVWAAKTTIKHRAPDFFIPRYRIEVEAKIIDADGIEHARCYFRVVGEPVFFFVGMKRADGDVFKGYLPAPGRFAKEIEYVFLAVDGQKQVARSQEFILARGQAKSVPEWQYVSTEGALTVYTELDPPAEHIYGFPDKLAIHAVPQKQKFGVLAEGMYAGDQAGLLDTTRGSLVMQGYKSTGRVKAKELGSGKSYVKPLLWGSGIALAAGGVALAVAGSGDGDSSSSDSGDTNDGDTNNGASNGGTEPNPDTNMVAVVGVWSGVSSDGSNLVIDLRDNTTALITGTEFSATGVYILTGDRISISAVDIFGQPYTASGSVLPGSIFVNDNKGVSTTLLRN